jgi:hypothetical protein
MINRARANFEFPITICWKNVGQIDIESPIILVTCSEKIIDVNNEILILVGLSEEDKALMAPLQSRCTTIKTKSAGPIVIIREFEIFTE